MTDALDAVAWVAAVVLLGGAAFGAHGVATAPETTVEVRDASPTDTGGCHVDLGVDPVGEEFVVVDVESHPFASQTVHERTALGFDVIRASRVTAYTMHEGGTHEVVLDVRLSSDCTVEEVSES